MGTSGDAAVSAFCSTSAEQTLQTYYDGLGGGWFWRGTDSRTLSEHPEKNIDKLSKAVDDMFKKFPPPSRG